MNKILDYDQVIDRLQKITANNLVMEEKPIGYSSFRFPIRHYTFGTGNYHIVISGSTHGSELISTDLVLKLMETLPKEIDKDLFTIHFFPMINPEGYLVSTSAVRKLIPRDMPDSDAQVIIKKYVEAYNSHDLSYQDMFKDVDYSCISSTYISLKENIKSLCDKYNLPKGILQVWSANGNGVDLNQNCPYNAKLAKMQSGETIYGHAPYSNIVMSQPGPIGCPSKTTNFEYEYETKAFRNFMLNLKHNKTLCGYINYHSAEDTIFYKPMDIEIDPTEALSNIELLTEYNKELATIYSSNTSQQLFDGDSKFCCFNDMLRLEIPGDILVELSPNEGNPLSAYDDTVYHKTIQENIDAAIKVIKQMPKLYEEKFN